MHRTYPVDGICVCVCRGRGILDYSKCNASQLAMANRQNNEVRSLCSWNLQLCNLGLCPFAENMELQTIPIHPLTRITCLPNPELKSTRQTYFRASDIGCQRIYFYRQTSISINASHKFHAIKWMIPSRFMLWRRMRCELKSLFAVPKIRHLCRLRTETKRFHKYKWINDW